MASFSRRHIEIDDADPKIVYLEPHARPVLIQTSVDQYELRQGRRLLGIVAFQDGDIQWGWRFFPTQNGKRPSRVLHPYPEATLKGRHLISEIYPMTHMRHIR